MDKEPKARGRAATTKKATAKKAAAKKPARGKKSSKSVIVTDNAVLISMSPTLQKQAQRCLKKTGKITISLNEISVTRLPTLLDNGVKID